MFDTYTKMSSVSHEEMLNWTTCREKKLALFQTTQYWKVLNWGDNGISETLYIKQLQFDFLVLDEIDSPEGIVVAQISYMLLNIPGSHDASTFDIAILELYIIGFDGFKLCE